MFGHRDGGQVPPPQGLPAIRLQVIIDWLKKNDVFFTTCRNFSILSPW